MTQLLNNTASLDRLLAEATEAADRVASTCASCDSHESASRMPAAAEWTPFFGSSGATSAVCHDCADVLATVSF